MSGPIYINRSNHSNLILNETLMSSGSVLFSSHHMKIAFLFSLLSNRWLLPPHSLCLHIVLWLRTELSSVGSLARCASGRARVRSLAITTCIPHRYRDSVVCVRSGMCKSWYNTFWDFLYSLVCTEFGQRVRPNSYMTPCCFGCFQKKKSKFHWRSPNLSRDFK